MKNHKNLIVMAATRVDVELGVELLRSLQVPILSCYLSENPYEQTLLQLNPAQLTSLVYKTLDKLFSRKVCCIAIYCNSLSGAIGSETLKELKRRYKVPVITPLDVYEDCAIQSNRWAVLAANGQSLSHIERRLLLRNPACTVVGFCSLKLVEAVEMRQPADQIIDQYGVMEVFDVFTKQGCQSAIIGCTHFVYFMKELRRKLQKASLRISVIESSCDLLKRVAQAIC